MLMIWRKGQKRRSPTTAIARQDFNLDTPTLSIYLSRESQLLRLHFN
jgi:hypothetical protein